MGMNKMEHADNQEHADKIEIDREEAGNMIMMMSYSMME